MDGPAELFPVFRAEAVGDDHRCAGGQAGEQAHHELNDDRGGAAHGGQGVGAHELAHDDGVHGVIKLLEEGAGGDGEEEAQKLFPDDPLGQV